MGLKFKTVMTTSHALTKCAEKQIKADDAVNVAKTGEVIREYPDESPFPCYLLLGWVKERPLHVVAALDAAAEQCILVTAYWPDPDLWEADFRTKRPQ